MDTSPFLTLPMKNTCDINFIYGVYNFRHEGRGQFSVVFLIRAAFDLLFLSVLYSP